MCEAMNNYTIHHIIMTLSVIFINIHLLNNETFLVV